MMDLALYRRFYADDLQATVNPSTPGLVEALAAVPRERFLPPGPWTMWTSRSELGASAHARRTPDADPRHVYHDVAVALDEARRLFNGAPSLVATAIDSLQLSPGARVLHIGTGTGYYTAIMAHVVGAAGRVLGVEIDADLAGAARANVAGTPWVEVRTGDGTGALGEAFDAVLINAGVTHPLDGWLDALAPGGRMVVPLTASVPGMGTIGKGLLIALTRGDHPHDLAARLITFVAIYSAVGIRDDRLDAALGAALTRNPFPRIQRLRRDPHDAGGRCWLHGPTCCLSLDPPA
jgi:protein-L-isoaspartate(D-aspartate) O-methyltransferase